ncbi:hypothetical protein PV327_010687 [Microctonus hyperodae]|uniref:Uncharacterized protein n=1 Tax=Microctonus hyperodae TaxID=165561 RepID=A0AA39C810_MICHY|nr:hypothetical protein PV327_010687 [Microctonus hyperodae]
MQASAEANSLDLQAMQSMDWLFKKERIYLLAQFWQQRATLAEKELSTLKEQVAASSDGNSKTEGHNTSQNVQSTEQNYEQSSNPRRTPSNLEQELQAKDKEGKRVSSLSSFDAARPACRWWLSPTIHRVKVDKTNEKERESEITRLV